MSAENPTVAEIAEYIADNYGECSVEPCICLKTGWIGTACFNWKPTRAVNMEELRAAMLAKVGR